MMQKKPTAGYSLIAVVLHWAMAVLIFILFPLGIYMTGLTYYDSNYKFTFLWHESIGMLVFALLFIRLGWRLLSQLPDLSLEMPRWQFIAAKTAHGLFYILMLLVCVSGYLISTAEGQGINVWNIFSVPALSSFETGFADQAGLLHWYAALVLIVLAGVHTLAALYHHFILKDQILINIIKGDRYEK